MFSTWCSFVPNQWVNGIAMDKHLDWILFSNYMIICWPKMSLKISKQNIHPYLFKYFFSRIDEFWIPPNLSSRFCTIGNSYDAYSIRSCEINFANDFLFPFRWLLMKMECNQTKLMNTFGSLESNWVQSIFRSLNFNCFQTVLSNLNCQTRAHTNTRSLHIYIVWVSNFWQLMRWQVLLHPQHFKQIFVFMLH